MSKEPTDSKPSPVPPQPYDRTYRSFYAYPEIVEGTLRGFFRQPWVDNVDFSTLRQLPDVFVSENLDRREADSIWQAQCQDRMVLLYFAFEFQSQPLWYMALRVMGLEGLLYQRLVDKGILPPGKVPLIIPIVVYNGRGPWTAALGTAELVEEHQGLESIHPRVSYLLLDLHRLPMAELREVDHPVAVLFELERSDSPEDVARGIDRLVGMLSEDHPLRKVFLSWLRFVLVPLRVEDADVPEVQRLEDFKTMLEEHRYLWSDKWQAEGEKRGREEGEKRGVRTGEAKVLKRLIKLKYHVLPDEIGQRIDEAESEQILEWTDRLVFAETLDEVFSPAH